MKIEENRLFIHWNIMRNEKNMKKRKDSVKKKNLFMLTDAIENITVIM